jgi:FAD/FMN-containing dehydrogenase
LPDDAIDLHLKYGRELPTMLSLMHMYPINGAASKRKNTDTAWNYRKSTWAVVYVGVDPDPANKEIITKWTKEYYNELHKYSAGGAYVNFLMDDEGSERVKAAYGKNYAKLAALKKKYDPKNLFRFNQNIVPKA